MSSSTAGIELTAREEVMGMLFNTGATKEILAQLNAKFASGTLPGLVGLEPTFANFPLPGGTEAFVINQLNIIPDPTRFPHGRLRWIKWLNHMDLHDNAKRPHEKVAKTIGTGISNALLGLNEQGGNQQFGQIEFFAVPDGTHTKISADVTDVCDESGDWSKVITVYTNTYDKLNDGLE